jgi:integrase
LLVPHASFRQDTVRSLPYVGRGGKHQCIYWEASFECFGIRVFPSGRRTYVYSYRVQGRKRLGKIGRVDVLTLDQARKKAKACLGKVADREDPQQVADAEKEIPTVEQLVDAYIKEYAKPKKKTWENDQSTLTRNLLSAHGAALATTITSAEISAIHVRIGVKHPYAANTFLDVVRKMYNWAKKPAKLIPKDNENPVAGITRFPQYKRRRFLTTVEMPRFIRGLEAEHSDYARHAIWMLLLTGLRMREILKAKWDHVDWDQGTLFIGLTKNGEPLLAPLSDAALARLRMIPRIAGNAHIICGQKPGRHLANLHAAFKRVKKRAAIENLRIHDLRRTVGSWLAQAGVSLHLIGDVLNHLDTSTTAGYAYFQTQDRRKALSGHADKVLKLGAPHLLEQSKPESIAIDSLLLPNPETHHAQTCADQARHRHYFRREALYALVWTAPVMEIAGRLGVSDVALAKLCRRAAIPLPARGYWARVEAGQSPSVPALPPAPEAMPELLRIRGSKAAGANSAGGASAIDANSHAVPA